MSPTMISIITQTRITKLCLNHFGYKPSMMDITQKLGHINRCDNPAPCDMKSLRNHIINTMMRFIAVNFPIEKRKVIEAEIARIKSQSKPLPLP